MTHHKNRFTVPLALATLLFSSVVATGQEPEIAVEVPAGVKIVIADDANRVKNLLKLSGEQEKLAADVTYANFTSGPLRLEAIRAGAADVGAVGDVPPILAHFSAANVPIVGGVRSDGIGNLLAVAPGSGVNGIADLKGKKVAINVGTAQQANVLRNLKSVGLGAKDIEIINLGVAEFADALRANQIDAAVLKQPDRSRYLASAAKDGAKEIPNQPGANTGLSYLYAAKVALDDPAKAAAIRDFVIRWHRANIWRNNNRETWIKEYLVNDQKLSYEDAVIVDKSDGNALPVAFDDELIKIQQDTIDLLQEGGAFAGKTLNARDEFDLRFADLNEKSPASND